LASSEAPEILANGVIAKNIPAIVAVITTHVVPVRKEVVGRKPYIHRNYEPEMLDIAVGAVLSRVLSQRQASRTYGVPQPTISKRIRMLKQRALISEEGYLTQNQPSNPTN